jgi:hypothetical protein
MNYSINEIKNVNYINNELYGTNLMLVYCKIHDSCYLRQSSSEDCNNYACLLTYKPPHTKYELANVCDYTDLYNMGIFNFYENKETNKVDITIIEDVRIDYGRFGNVTQFIDFYNKNTESITDECGNEIVYKNNNLAEWFEYIQDNQTDFGQFLNKGETFFNY